MKVEIESRSVSTGKLYNLLKESISVDLELLSTNSPKTRGGVDPSIIVAIIGSSSVLIGAIITGLFQIAAQARIGKITIKGKSGRSIEIPIKSSEEVIASAVEAAKQLDIERIITER